MSEIKHTPGPWKRFDLYNHIEIRNERDELIAVVGPDQLKAARFANARLIGASPELLEACKTFAEWLRREQEGWAGDRDTPEGEAAWRKWFYENLRICDLAQTQAIAAIAKAEGAQQ